MTDQIALAGLELPSSSLPLTRGSINALHRAHSALRDADGLHADKALDELCKVLFVKMWDEMQNGPASALPASSLDEKALLEIVEQLYVEARKHAFGSGLDKAAVGAFAEPIQLSPSALVRVLCALAPLSLLNSAADIKGAAFQQVLSAAVRNGMGQYFTPEPVVDCIVAMVSPRAGERILDPFCGSGRFLSGANRFHIHTDSGNIPLELHGIEKSDRMVRIALTEVLIDGIETIAFHRGDSLVSPISRSSDFDVVLTNPPFGSLLDTTEHLRRDFELANLFDSVPLEVLGIEICAKALKKGGRAAIVLPESILNTKQMQPVREYILRKFNVIGILSLPPQTFAPFDGVGKASVLFLQKADRPKKEQRVFIARPENIGYDNTGRRVPDNDLPPIAKAFREFLKHPTAEPKQMIEVDSTLFAKNFSYSAVRASRHSQNDTVCLSDLCLTVKSGSTPAKQQYTNEGARILKVGDLSGSGIDWEPRDRGFVDPKFVLSRKRQIEVGDILTTAAAHHPKYIGQKVDIVDRIPKIYAKEAVGFVSELLMVRVDPSKCNPYLLLMWLRSPDGYYALQSCVVGQTGHLYPEDALKIRVPKSILTVTPELEHAIETLKSSLQYRKMHQEAELKAASVFQSAIGS